MQALGNELRSRRLCFVLFNGSGSLSISYGDILEEEKKVSMLTFYVSFCF